MERQAEASKTRLTFSQKWGDDPFTQSGHTQVPNALIVYAHRLGLRSEECWLITCILRFKYDASNPSPSQEKLAELFGQSVDTVQRTIKKIVEKRLLKVERIRDEGTHRFTHTVYDFTPLRFALNECHYQDHPEERPQMPIPLEKPTPQNCGLAPEGHTAELRPGSERNPHRSSAAWSTPQNCGLHKENKKSISIQEERALNVRGGEDEAPTTERSTLNASGIGIYAIRDKAVEETVSLTGDEGSRRRFQQLWEIAEGREALDAWKAALRATERRLKATAKAPLDRPGAYFDRVCVGELAKREIFVSSAEEKQVDTGVAELVRQELFSLTDKTADTEVAEREKSQEALPFSLPVAKIPPKQQGADAGDTREQLDAELLRLEREGGAPYAAFQVYLAAEKERHASEFGTMSVTARARLLEAFDRQEKRRSLYRVWKEINGL